MKGRGAAPDRLRSSFAALDENLRTEGCPDPATIWDAVHARLNPSRIRQVIEHTALCPSCASDWRVAMRSPTAEAAGSSRGWPRFAAVAAILLAAIVFGVSRFGDPAPGIPVYRTSTDSTIRSLLPPDESISRGKALLRWNAIGEGALYDVEVGTLDLTPLATAREIEETEFLIPAPALDSLADGESIVWRIEATLPDGRHVSSEAFITRLE